MRSCIEMAFRNLHFAKAIKGEKMQKKFSDPRITGKFAGDRAWSFVAVAVLVKEAEDGEIVCQYANATRRGLASKG